MARKPRPLDPNDGPLQAFAYDLRLLRDEAGSPPYRALAKKAGYSATTLSEAAGGVRQPSLDVTLAFVGACGGDADLWRSRWQQLDKELARRAPVRAIDGEATATNVPPGENVVVERVGDPLPLEPADHLTVGAPVAQPRRFRLSPLMALLCVGLTVALAFTVSDRHKNHGSATGGASWCPGTAKSGVFQGMTYGTITHIRAGAALDQPDVRDVPPKCVLGFSGYCLGEVVPDMTSATPDMRWFKLTGGGVVSSAVVHGNPPAGMRPSRCPGDVAAPSTIKLSVRQSGQELLAVSAAGTHVEIVGYAAYYAVGKASPQWHQIGLTAGAPAFRTSWRLNQLGSRGKVKVAAAACLGGAGPTGIVDVKSVDLASRAHASEIKATAVVRAAAETAACQYPNSR